MEDVRKKPKEILERLKSASFPPAAVAGALASFAGAALAKEQPAKTPNSSGEGLVQLGQTPGKNFPIPAPVKLEIEYKTPSVLQTRFRKSLSGIAVGQAGSILALADGEVWIFGRNGEGVRNWKAPEKATCLAVDDKDKIYLGAAGRVEIFDFLGNHKQGFEAGEPGKPAEVTSIKVLPKEILVADAAVRFIRRFGYDGKRLGSIGTQTKTGGFMLPNRFLDIDVSAGGMVVAADSGRHRVSAWMLDGTPLRHFGKFGLLNPEDFVGCCNPVNIALAPDGKIVTAEKVIPRIKVYSADGKLLALIGPENFDPKCTHLHLAIDSRGRILVADPVRLEVKIFSAANSTGGHQSA